MKWTAFRRIALLSGVLATTTAWACSISHQTTPEELLAGADAVVRAVAVDYQTPPSDPRIRTTGVPDSVVRFDVLETIRGTAPAALALHGYLVQRDDFNDHPAPYNFVRPGGRAGSCFANSYRDHAQYLLFLRKARESSQMVVEWAALAPVNEQLHNEDDPWLLWVREQAAKLQQ